MSNIFTWDAQDIDLKECIKIKTNCQQDDTMVLQFNIYDYDNSVNLTNFNVTFIAKKPDGTIYGQAESIEKSNNYLKITCDSQLTSVTGRVVGTIVITDINGNRKGSYFVVLNVFGIINDDDRVVSKNFIDTLNRFDEDVAIALSLTTVFKNDIEQANNKINDINNAILNANNEINDIVNKAKDENTILETTTNSANMSNNNLNSTISQSNVSKSNLVLEIEEANETINTLKTTNKLYTEHIKNKDIHVTKLEKDKWNMDSINIDQLYDLLHKYVLQDAYIIDENSNNISNENGDVLTI